MSIEVETVMHRSSDFFVNLPVATEEKLAHLYRAIHLADLATFSYDHAQAVTVGVMRIKGYSDDLFLHWLHYIGHYVKSTYGGKWYLGQSSFPNSLLVRYHPSIVNGDGRIWNVGDLCWKDYYVKGKFSKSNFALFHKLKIEQVLGESNISNWNGMGFRPLE